MNGKLLRALTVFVRTVEMGSMSMAAAELGMTTSAVSQQIKQLEQDVGLALFNRSPRVMTLTEAGDVYYQNSLKIIAMANSTTEQLQLLQNNPRGQLKLVAPIGFGGGLLSAPLQQLTDTYNDFNIQLTLSDEPVDMIKLGADLALAIGPLNDASLTSKHMVDWPLVLCAHKNHAISQVPQLSFAELKHHTRIGHTTADFPASQQQTNQVEMLPSARITVNNMQSVISLVMDGIGYGLLPKIEILDALNSGELVALCPDWQFPDYSVYAVTPSRNSLAAKTSMALTTLQTHFENISKHLT